MDTFFSFLKKGIVATIFLVFSFSAVYIPHPANEIEKANAWEATEITQVMNNVLIGLGLSEQSAINVTTTIQAGYDALSAGYNAITSFAADNLYVKEYVLDGIAWAIAKAAISSMVQSLVNWINSGFEGSPAFVQDLSGTLLEAADKAAGEYIESLGGVGSFICSPFQLDIQIALSTKYQKSRVNEPEASCNLSDIVGNINDFLTGAQGSFSSGGGWDDWFTITSSPEVYTPYGSMLSAEIGAQAAIINAKGEKLSIIDFGSGFLSNEICEVAHGAGTAKEDCFISTPGKTIQDALSFNLDSGRQSLITADEIDEIIGALVGQLANQAISGAAGLLGLSEGTGYTYSGYNGGSYTSAMGSEATTLNYKNSTSTMKKSLTVQNDFLDILSPVAPNNGNPTTDIIKYNGKYYDFGAEVVKNNKAITVAQNKIATLNPNDDAGQIAQLNASIKKLKAKNDVLSGIIEERKDLIAELNDNIVKIENLVNIMENSDSTVSEKSTAVTRYTEITKYTKQSYSDIISNWISTTSIKPRP